jgi:hypothetical protein
MRMRNRIRLFTLIRIRIQIPASKNKGSNPCAQIGSSIIHKFWHPDPAYHFDAYSGYKMMRIHARIHKIAFQFIQNWLIISCKSTKHFKVFSCVRMKTNISYHAKPNLSHYHSGGKASYSGSNDDCIQVLRHLAAEQSKESSWFWKKNLNKYFYTCLRARK